jgi:hypothetical protein
MAKSAPRPDASGLAGLTRLMNPQHLQPGVDLAAAENAIMRKAPAGRAPAAEVDIAENYARELARVMTEFGVDLEAEPAGTSMLPSRGGGPARGGAAPAKAAAPPPPRQAAAPPPRQSAAPPPRQYAAAQPPPRQHGGAPPPRAPPPRAAPRREAAEEEEDEEDEDEYEYEEEGEGEGEYEYVYEDETDDEQIDETVANMGADLGWPEADAAAARAHRQRNTLEIDEGMADYRAQGFATDEQARRAHTTAVMADLRGGTQTSYSLASEREHTDKLQAIEQISQLRQALKEEGVDCSAIPVPTLTSSTEEIMAALDTLRTRNYRSRCASFAEEIMMGLAELVETVFDGTVELPVLGWKPDYRGYSATMNLKLHQARYDTSEVVGNIFRAAGMGPATRLAMELAPSFLLYPAQNRRERGGSPGLASDPRVGSSSAAFAAMRAADAKKSISNVMNI